MPLISLLCEKQRLARRTTLLAALLLATAFMLSLPARAEDREVVSKVKPVYPKIAQRLKVTGSVLLNVVVAPNGTVKSATTIMGHAALCEAAKDAVMKWKFAPAEYETTEQVEIQFP